MQAYLFSPEDGMANHRKKIRRQRKTPLSCGNSTGTNIKRAPKKQPTDRYHTSSYGRAIARACEIAFRMPPDWKRTFADRLHEGDTAELLAERAATRKAKSLRRSVWHRQWCWHPHQLRHIAGTRVRKQFGLEAARVVLGHRTMTVTQVYAEKNQEAAIQIMGQVG